MTEQLLCSLSDDVDVVRFGAKAAGLSWLARTGANVPEGIVLMGDTAGGVPLLSTRDGLEALQRALLSCETGGRYDVAVRSSASCEDTSQTSMAGHFLSLLGSFTFEELCDAIRQVGRSLLNIPVPRDATMAVIVQRLISSSCAGVALSSDPLDGAKDRVHVSVVAGTGDALVSGRAEGTHIVLAPRNGRWRPISPLGADISEETASHLAEIAKSLEAAAGHAVDLEWCLASGEKEPYLLQCRPLTGLAAPINCRVCRANVRMLPSIARAHQKVQMRLLSEATDIATSRAHVLVGAGRSGEAWPKELAPITLSSRATACSVVLLNPSQVNGTVQRRFAAPESCMAAVQDLLNLGAESTWSPTVIVQEIFDPVWTGMAKVVGDAVLIEVARGHFVPKGIVPTSSFVVDRRGEMLQKRYSPQRDAWRIYGSEVVQEHLLEPKPISTTAIRRIADTVWRYPNLSDRCLEFGVLDEDGSQVYLIDVAVDTTISSPELIDVDSGVISRGRIRGVIKHVKLPDEPNSLHMHHLDGIPHSAPGESPVVFIADRADISLLSIVHANDPTRIGFAFASASPLCHLALVLREKGIPALRTTYAGAFADGVLAELDTESKGLSINDRFRIV